MTSDRLKILFEPCKSKEELRLFILTFLGIDFPYSVVDEESNSSPLDLLWAIYEFMLTGKGNNRHVVAASRNSCKTLVISVMHWLSLLHFRREGAHIAATLDQSSTAIRYLDQFLNIPELQPYRIIDNIKTKILRNLPANSYTDKSECSLRVITATKKGANSPRCSFLSGDETDLMPKEILSEVAYVADPTRDGHNFDPVFVYLSSRKTNDGPLQDLINEAESPEAEGIQLHKWSQVDFMQKCSPDAHLPELPRIKIYLNTETLEKVIGGDVFKATVSSSSKGQYKEIYAYEGCKTCPAFLACQARAVKQTCNSSMLRTRRFVGDILKAVRDVAVIVAQSLNWRPESTALVFRMFSHYRHVKSYIDFYQFISGDYYNPNNLPEEELLRIFEDGTTTEITKITPTKSIIYRAMIENDWAINYGIDWGYLPDPALCTIIGYHKKTRRAAVLHTEFANYFSNYDWAQYVYTNIHSRFPANLICPDMADPASPTYFGKLGLPCLDTKPARIETGVSQLRSLLFNPITQQEHFAVLDSGTKDGNFYVIQSFLHWTHRKTPLGFDFDKYSDDEWTHSLDAIRYALHPFIQDIDISINAGQSYVEESLDMKAYKQTLKSGSKEVEVNAMKRQMDQHFLNEFGITGVFSGQNSKGSEAISVNPNQTAKDIEEIKKDAQDNKQITPQRPNRSIKWSF